MKVNRSRSWIDPKLEQCMQMNKKDSDGFKILTPEEFE